MPSNIDMAAISALIVAQSEAEVHGTFLGTEPQEMFSRPTGEAIKLVANGLLGYRTISAFVILADGMRLSHADCSSMVRQYKGIFEGIEV